MKKKNIIIILLSILVVLVLILFGYEKNKTKDTKKQTNIESNKTGTNPDESDITEEDFNTFSNFNNKLVEIEKTKYLNDNGYVDSDNITPLLDDVENFVAQGVSDGVIDHYTREDDNIFITYTSGITNLFIPYQEGTLSGTTAENSTSPKSYTPKPALGGNIITIEPNEDDLTVAQSYNIAKLDAFNDEKIKRKEDLYPKSNANLIANTLPGTYEYNTSLTNADVTVESLKKLGNYNIIIWEGHGGYNEELHSALITGENASVWDMWEIGSYINDMEEGRITTTTFPDIPLHFAITSKFIDEYISSMKGALIFLGNCYSLKDNELATSFINKGAYIVLGYTDSVTQSYEMYSRTSFFNELTTIKEDTQYQTASEAYQITINKVGMCKNGCILTGLTAMDGLDKRYTIRKLLPETKGQDTKESSDTSAADIKKLTKAWKDAYSNYVKEHGNLTDSFGNSLDIYTLIDINNDTIPELYGNLGSTANGDFVATYSKENGFVVQILWNYGFSYIPNKNLFHDAYGHMDHYEDRIYSIENGQIVLKHNGFYGSEEIYPQIDANGMPIYNYNWDGQNVSYEEYTQKLNAVYNTDESITPFDGAEYVDSRYVGNGLCNYQEILDAIENY